MSSSAVLLTCYVLQLLDVVPPSVEDDKPVRRNMESPSSGNVCDFTP